MPAAARVVRAAPTAAAAADWTAVEAGARRSQVEAKAVGVP